MKVRETVRVQVGSIEESVGVRKEPKMVGLGFGEGEVRRSWTIKYRRKDEDRVPKSRDL